MTGAQPGGSLMTCGQLTLSQLIRLLFSARLRPPSFLPQLLFHRPSDSDLSGVSSDGGGGVGWECIFF